MEYEEMPAEEQQAPADQPQQQAPEAPAPQSFDFRALAERIGGRGIRVAPGASRVRPGETAEDAIRRFSQEAHSAGLTSEEAESEARNRFGSLTPQNYGQVHREAGQQVRLGQERQRAAGQDETWSHYLSGLIPFRTVGELPWQQQHTNAIARFQQGNASPEDVRTIAQHERYQQILAGEDIGQSITRSLINIPGMIGEFALGGRLLGAGASQLGRLGTQAAPSLVSRAGTFAARTALTPSMYLEQAVQRNEEQGRSATDWRGFPAAVTMGMAQMGILGSISHFGNAITQTGVRGAAARFMTGLTTGLTEQHFLVEPIADAVSLALPRAYRLSTEQGPLSNAFQGKWGQAWRQFAVSAATFAAFSGLHEIQHGAPPTERVLGSDQSLMEHMARSGIPHDQIPARILDIDRWIDQGSARGQIEQMPDGPLKSYAQIRLQAVDAMRAAQQERGPQQDQQPRQITSEPGQPPALPSPEQLQQPATGQVNDLTRNFQGAVAEAFPGKPIHGATDTFRRVVMPDRMVDIRLDPQANTLRIDYGWRGRPGQAAEGQPRAMHQIGGELRGGSLEMVRELKRMATWAGENGVGLHVEPASPAHAQVYERQLTRLGFERGQDGIWRKPAEQTAGQTAQASMQLPEQAQAAPIAPQQPQSRADKYLAKARGKDASPRPAERPIERASPEKRTELQQHVSRMEASSAVSDLRAGAEITPERRQAANDAFGFNQQEANVFWQTRGPNARSLADVARDMGISRERVRQISNEADHKAGMTETPAAEAGRARAARQTETPGLAQAETSGFREPGNVREDMMDRLHNDMIKMIDTAVERGEPISHEDINKAMEHYSGEEANAYRELLQNYGDSAPVRTAAEQALSRADADQSVSPQGQAGDRVQPGQEAARPAQERGASPEADLGTNAPADAQRSEAAGGVERQNPLPEPSLRSFISSEEGALVPQAVTDWVKKKYRQFTTAVTDRSIDAARAEADAVARGYRPNAGASLTDAVQATRNATAPLAQQYAERGISTYRNGHEITIGKPFEQLMKPALPEDLKPVSGPLAQRTAHWFEDPSKATPLDVHMTARSIVDEAARGNSMVPASWEAEARQVLFDFQKNDPAFSARADQVHRNLIQNVWNASLLARAAPEIHNISAPNAINYINSHPWYIDARRGMKPEEFLVPNKAYNTLMRQGSSDRPFMPPLESAKMRLMETAASINEQIVRNRWEQVLSTPGMNHWSEPAKPGQAQDPRIATWRWNDAQGNPTYRVIKDKGLYEFMTGSQGHDQPLLGMIKALGDVELGTGRQILPFMSDVVKTAAVPLNAAFQVRNIMRDAYTFLSNTISQSSAVRLPEFYKRAFQFEWGILTGKPRRDAILEELKSIRGEDMKYISFGSQGLNSGGIPTIKTWGDFAKQAVRLLNAAELAPRALELSTRYNQLGWSEARLRQERDAAAQRASQGRPYVDPVPLETRTAAGNAAREVTVDFSKGGVYTDELNRVVPFFRPAVAGVYKAINNWKNNTKGAAIALAGYLGLRMMHWMMYSDEEWYKNLSDYDRFNNFVVPMGGTLQRLPGARDLEIPAGGALISMLEAIQGRDPRLLGLMRQSSEALLPPMPLPTPARVAYDIGTNQDFAGRPIVPSSEQSAPLGERIRDRYAPYITRQLTGGRGELSLRGLTGYGGEVRPSQPLNDYHELRKELEGARTRARRSNQPFALEGRYQAFSNSAAADAITTLQQQYRQARSEEEKNRIRTIQNRLARDLLRTVR